MTRDRQSSKCSLLETTACDQVPPAKSPCESSNAQGETESKGASVVQVKQLRLPIQCLVPTSFTKNVLDTIEANKLAGVMKTRLLRQAATFHWGLCPSPSPEEYTETAVALCNKYKQLKDTMPLKGKYWVSYLFSIIAVLIKNAIL